MKVTVTKFLNVRVGKASLNAPCYQYLSPGSELEVDGKLYPGDFFEGVNTWMKDEAGNYYWSGGLDYITQYKKQNIKPAIINYNEQINLPDEVKATKGKNIVIGIVDTGCYKHPALEMNIINGKNFLDSSIDFEDESYANHGTFVSGLVASNKIENSEMVGVAPEAKLIIAKITENRSIGNPKVILESLKWLIEQKPDIINMSLEFFSDDLRSEFDIVFKNIASRNILLVAAGCDNFELYNDGALSYPSSDKNVIAVGSVNKNNYSKNYTKKINPKIKYLVEEIEFTSSIYNLYSKGIGSSFATALVTGSFALTLSYLKQKQKIENPVEEMDKWITALNQPEQLKGNINIYKA